MMDSLLNYFDSCEADMFSLLEKLVLQESYTTDKEGVDRVGLLIRDSLRDCGMKLTTERQVDLGDHLVFSSAAALGKTPSVLLVGHMDTVFPPEMGFDWYREDDVNAYGPGVIDMKGGLVVAIFAIKALSHTGLLDSIPITFICNSDEETGSLSSKPLLRREAKKSLLALVFECGGPAGEMVTGRKGKSGHLITVTGQAGHAAMAGKNKASSLLELAHKIIAIEALNTISKHQLVVNVGLVKGGIGPNTVAEKSYAHVDCRFPTRAAGDYYDEQIKNIVENCTVAGTHAISEITSSRTVMESSTHNKKLLELFSEQAGYLNLAIGEELRSGVSDANTLSGCEIPVLDGLGPIGEHDHSDKEYMVKDSLVSRAKLTAVSLLEINQRQIKGELFL